MLTESIRTEKREAAARIKAETEAFLKAGGKIEVLDLKKNEPLKRMTLKQRARESYLKTQDELAAKEQV